MSSIRILLVDDQEAYRRGVRSLLSSRGDWTVCGEAADGIEAVDQAKSLNPDVVLMDVSMPRMNGLDATRIIRRELPRSRVVIVSQNDPAIVRIQAREVDAAGYIEKNKLAERLLPTIDEITGREPEQAPLKSETRASRAKAGTWLAGGGLMGHLIREHDWSETPLGPIEKWPLNLKTSINLMLNSRHPMWIGWGPEMTFLYNDAYISVLSMAKHPKCLGHPARKVWAEIWDICGPLADKVFEKGEATFVDDVRLFMSRGEFLEETYYSFSYSPIHNDSGKVVGLFCPSTETTPKILNVRRLGTLSELAAKALAERTTEAACASSFATLAKNPDDIPFALLYLLDGEGQSAQLEQSTGASRGIVHVSPTQFDLSSKSTAVPFWPVSKVLDTGRPEIVSLSNLESVPLGPAGQCVSDAIVQPVTSAQQDRPVGVLIAGINPTRKLDPEYKTFFDLLTSQVATAIQNARAAEDALKRAEALAEIDRAKTVFFSNVSHEFRTPLTLMLGPVEDLLSRGHDDLPADAKSQLELVHRNGTRLFRLVNTLLDFSRIEAGRMQVLYQPTDLSAFTQELASVFRSVTERAGLRLRLDCPPLGEPVYIDRDMWEKIVFNLISNAFKFTFEGEIDVTLLQTGDAVELRVRDTGVGIPAKELPRLFDRFHRVQNTRSRTHEGSGIGLALAHELVKIHGGSIRVESTVGAGTTFIVSIPLGTAHLPAERIGRTRELASTAIGATVFLEEVSGWLPDIDTFSSDVESSPGVELMPVSRRSVSSHAGRPHILVVDDNADMRRYLQRLLAERYEVETVSNGRRAFESAQERAPDLILSDVMMPELDGFGLLRELRSSPVTRTIPVILLSARAGEESRVEGMEHGADDYLIKPFSARESLARVHTHLELSRVRKLNEDVLRQRTAQFETLLDAAPMGVYVVDADFRIQHLNPTARKAFGNIPNLEGRDFEEAIRILWPAGYADEIVARFRHTLETGEPYIVPERDEERADRGVRETYEWQINRIPLAGGRYGVVCYFRDITAQVQTREALRASEIRLRHFGALVDSSDDAIISKDLNGVIASWNRGAEQMFGYTEKEAIGRHITLIIPPDRREEEVTILDRLKRGMRIDHFETVRMRKDGSLFDISVTISPVKDDDGRVIGASKIARDITERRQAERTLRESEERFRTIVETTPECVKLVAPDGTVLHMNSSGLAMVGADCAENVVGRSIFDLIAPNDVAKVREFHRGICGGENDSLEFDIITLEGKLRHMETYAAPFRMPDGQLAQLAVARDVTDRKHSEERERQMTAEAIAATAKFRAVFEQTAVFAGIMTTDGIVTEANRLSLDACGFRAEDVLGRPFWETGWWQGSKEVQEKIRAGTRQAAKGTPYRETLTYYWADGTERLVDFGLHPIRNDRGEIIFLHPTGVDITDIKTAETKYRSLSESLESQVQSRTQELEKRNKEVQLQSEQLRMLSHRLIQIQDSERRRIARELHDSAGQVLTALGMNLATVAHYAKGTTPQLAEIAAEGQSLVRELSQEIRTMSYLLHPPLLDENGLSEALRWYIQGLKERSGLEVSLTIPEDFGRVPRDMELVIFRIIQEGLTNIHRHSGSNVAKIRMARELRCVSLEVEDQGKGMSPEKLADIQTRGTGVGLRGMRERVVQLGGKMEIRSNAGGTTISISFPVDESEQSSVKGPIPSSRPLVERAQG